MKKAQYLIIAVLWLLVSCSHPLPYKSLSESNIQEVISSFPQQEDHPNAAAIALLNYQSVEVLKDGKLIQINISRYKIFNERGYYLATKSIAYRDGYQKVKILFANTIKPDGTILPLKEKDIVDTSPYSQYEYYTDVKQKSFTMPGIEPGCIVEYAYKIETNNTTLPYDLYIRFFIQEKIPLVEDVLEITLPSNIKLNAAYFKTDIKPVVEEGKGNTRYTFKNLNKKEIIPEPDMPEMFDKEAFPQLYCWTLSSWNIVSKWYSDLVREQMQIDAELEAFTKKLIANKTNYEDKLRAIFYFVAQEVRYVAVELGPHTHVPHVAYDVFRKRYGDCKDKTTLLLTMLKIAGIEGFPVLVPADPELLDESAPTTSVFDHVIAAVPKKDGTYYWLDATNEVAAIDSGPFDISQKVLLIKLDGSYKFVKTPAFDDNKDYVDYKRINHINEDGDAAIDSTYVYYGKAAESQRQSFKNMSPEKRKQYFEEQGKELHNLEILNLDAPELPLIIKIQGLVRNTVSKIDDSLMVLSGKAGVIDYDELISAKSRKYPISFQESYLIKFNVIYYLPNGYKIRKLPGNFKREDPYNVNYLQYEYRDNIFSIEGKTKLLKHKIEPSEFESFKKDALERQKYKTKVNNIIFEKQQ